MTAHQKIEELIKDVRTQEDEMFNWNWDTNESAQYHLQAELNWHKSVKRYVKAIEYLMSGDYSYDDEFPDIDLNNSEFDTLGHIW